MSHRVHLAIGDPPQPACGCTARRDSTHISSTRGTRKVDCPNCLRTDAYRQQTPALVNGR